MVRFYETVDQSHDDNDDVVELLYAVTYEEEGERKSFFVDVEALRMKLADGSADWRNSPNRRRRKARRMVMGGSGAGLQ